MEADRVIIGLRKGPIHIMITTDTTRKLKSLGATLIRSNKHPIWRLPNGKMFVCSSTPGNSQGVKNELCRLKRMAASA